MGRSYTRDVVALSSHVDDFINYDELESLPAQEAAKHLSGYKADCFVHVFPKREIARLAAAAGIPLRVGTTSRLYHWLTCNRLLRLSRRNSPLHEAQLNMRLLQFTGIDTNIALNQVPALYGFDRLPAADNGMLELLDSRKFNLILHPRSKGSAREWGLDNFTKLIEALPPERYRIFVSGTAQDAESMTDFLKHPRIHDITGRFSLREFIAFIHLCDGLVAASTGPLHIAAALGKKAVGLFSQCRPIHPGRWAPLGIHAGWLVMDRECPDCAAGKDCDCIRNINPNEVIRKLEAL